MRWLPVPALSLGVLAQSNVQSNVTAAGGCGALRNSTNIPIFFPGQSEYSVDISHYALSSSQMSACSVEPANAHQLSQLIKAIGKHRLPFAVKSGGHATNKNFSSTPGIHISMSSFTDLRYDAASSTALVGSGLIWDDVYAILEKQNVTVLGGRVSGIGVGGFLLGGGYTWFTNSHGLAIDNLVSFELVTPQGDIIIVSEGQHPDLFLAVRGSWNNFGIVTKFTLKAFPIRQVVAGAVLYNESAFDAVRDATARFNVESTDSKAQMYSTFANIAGQRIAVATLLYNDTKLPNGTFDEFFSIPHLTNDVATRSFADFVKSQIESGPSHRAIYDTVAVLRHTPSLIGQIINQTTFWGSQQDSHSGTGITYTPQPFLRSLYDHAKPAAYPHDPSLPLLPVSITYSWDDPAEDSFWTSAVKQSVGVIYEQALREGQDVDARQFHQIRYGNYASTGTPIQLIWGRNIPRLQSLKRIYDPYDVMGLAGGFKL